MRASEFGLVPNTGQDLTSKFREVLALCKRRVDPTKLNEGPPLLLESGDYVISDTVDVVASMGFSVRGAGGNDRSDSHGWNPFRCGTRVIWKGGNKPVFLLDGCTGFSLEGVTITGQFSRPSHGVIVKHGASNLGSLEVNFRDCAFNYCDVGLQYGSGESRRELTAANSTIDSCYWRDCKSCVKVTNQQAMEFLFLRPTFNFSEVCFDFLEGGNLTSIGGGTHSIDTFLKIGNTGSNLRGFLIQGMKFDGQKAGRGKAKWLEYYDPTVRKTYGCVTFQQCTHTQAHKTGNYPMIEVANGAACVMRECSLNHETPPLARLYGGQNWTKFIMSDCDGDLGGTPEQFIEIVGDKSKCQYEITRSGTPYVRPVDYHSFNLDYPWTKPQPVSEELIKAIQNIALHDVFSLDTNKLKQLEGIDLDKLQKSIEVSEKVANIE